MLIGNTGTFSNELNSFQFKMVTKRSIKLPITKRNLCWESHRKMNTSVDLLLNGLYLNDGKKYI